MRYRNSIPIILLLVSGPSLPVAAQEDASFAGFQFNRSLPGARSLGLGGAFVALADDATAAYSNPAGLTLLEKPEASLEVRQWNLTTPFTFAGDGTAQSSFRPSQFTLSSSQSTTESISFASAAYSKPGARWALAIYKHQLAEYRTQFSSDGVRKSADEFFGPLDFSTDLSVSNLGISGSLRASDRLRIGVGISYYTLNLKSRQVIRKPTFSLTGGKDGDDTAVSANIGLLWQVAPVWTVGASYRQGPQFSISECFPSDRTPCFDRVREGAQPGGFDVSSRLELPDQFAIGLALRPTAALTFILELDRITYSNLLRGNRLGNFSSDGTRYQFHLDDATEVRLGTEYTVDRGDGDSVTFLAGGWYDPDHTISFRASGQAASVRFRRAYFLPTGKNEIHLSAGLEAKLGRYQVNLAIDRSDRVSTVALSTVVNL